MMPKVKKEIAATSAIIATKNSMLITKTFSLKILYLKERKMKITPTTKVIPEMMKNDKAEFFISL